MVDILHRVGITTSTPESGTPESGTPERGTSESGTPERGTSESGTPAVYDALTTVEGLAGWWTDDTKGSSDVGGVLEFRFPAGGFDMKVVDLRPSERVTWRVVDGPEEWVGTTVEWDLRQDGDYTIVLFAHRGWKDPVEFMHHCSTKWATFLLSLKALVETGKGAPSPRDVKIDDWN